ncbi:hypothetical protein SAMN05216376_10516 [Mameliella alba]|uniref:hypothetical protein n=1 Tax=Mameliella alba TaxID=561184 RepID=UPI000891ECF7|nr:hypothetical protein [Mameliella alba]OWV48082.1 hypothetical protein CDZ96_09655 [Mameliella alba]PTR40110.1 hypothetical protein LX94_01589 [Mameliella alba]GGF42340.1 hypothetical protein GCM10011319_00160 [Mameliella alba]SDC92823.1 hypothetical protein SAMN05216376_10516 [Mameliella alba]
MPDQSARRAALATLFILQAVMLGALYAGVPPHPPQAIPLFAMAPFLGAALGLCAAAYLLADQSRTGGVLAALAALAALVSFGPQKYVDPAFPMIWPAVVTAQAACAVLLTGILRRARPLPVS